MRSWRAALRFLRPQPIEGRAVGASVPRAEAKRSRRAAVAEAPGSPHSLDCDYRSGAAGVPRATRQVLGMAMRRGCQAAGLALYSPHDLRHRYASVKVKEGVPVTAWLPNSATLASR